MNMPVVVLVAVAAMLVLSLLMALPKGKMGCLMDVLRLLALVAGSLVPVGVVWVLGDKSGAWWFWVLAVLSVVLGSCAMGLAAFGWQTFFPGWIAVRPPKKRRGKTAGKAPTAAKGAAAGAVAATAVPDLEQQVDLSIFDPSAYMYTPSIGGNHPNQDPFGDCLFALFIGIVGGIFWLGLQLAQGIAKVLLPGLPVSTTVDAMQDVGARRVARALLCFVYGVGIVVVATIALYYASGRLESVVRG